MFKAYPLTVVPILKEQVWGGRALSKIVKLPAGKKIGEAWFFADQPANQSVISSGAYKGKKFSSIMQKHAKSILGPVLVKKYGKSFPLMFKFIDSRDKLSVQVHPGGKYGGKNSKTEAWYVIDSGRGAHVMLGLKKSFSPVKIAELAATGGITAQMKNYGSRRGDFFFVPAGTVHAIGPSNVIFEIQQNSDITYRLYDWGRGKRPLHVKDAIAAIKNGNAADAGRKIRVSCGFFGAAEAVMEKGTRYRYNKNSVMVFSVMAGGITITSGPGKWIFGKGAVVLMPYSFSNFMITAQKKSKLVVVEAR